MRVVQFRGTNLWSADDRAWVDVDVTALIDVNDSQDQSAGSAVQAESRARTNG